jgi:DNA repair exonuclease SbcCD ATPase subunit
VFVDGVGYTQDRIGDTQTFIERLLGVSDYTFEICTMIGKEGLSLLDKSSASRVEYMVDLFKMGDVDVIADVINKQENEAKFNVNQIAVLLASAKDQLVQLKSAVVQQPNPFALATSESKKSEADKNIGGWRQSVAMFDQQNRDIDAWNGALETAFNNASSFEQRVAQENLDLNAALDRATAALNEGMLMKAGGPRNCPKCGAVMDDLHVAAHIEELSNEFGAAQERVKLKEFEHENAVKATQAAKDKIQKESKVRVGVEERVNADKQIAAWQVVSDAAAAEIRNHNDIVRAHEQHALRVQMATSACEDGEVQLADANGQAAYWAYIKKHFNAPRIKEQVCTTVKNFLNDTASYYLSRIFGSGVGVLCDVSIQHTKTKDNLKFEIYVLRDQNKVPIEQYSKGEKASVRVAFDLAVSNLVSSVCPAQFRFIILDEALDGLDAAKRDAIAELVKELVATRGTAFMVSHTKAASAMKFDHTIQVEKVGGISKAVLI